MRRALVLIGLLLAAIGCVLGLAGIWPAATWLIGLGAVMTLGAAFERPRYKPAEDETPGPGWQRTGESFVENGVDITVWHHTASGERRYVRSTGAAKR